MKKARLIRSRELILTTVVVVVFLVLISVPGLAQQTEVEEATDRVVSGFLATVMDADAERMEALEIKALETLNIANPY